MSLGFREISGRALRLLAIVGLLAAAAPGCDNAANPRSGAGASQIPPAVQESNKNMQDFMKTKPAAKK